MSLKDDLFTLLKSSEGGLSENEICAKLKLPKHLRKRVQQALQELESSGKAHKNSRHRYAASGGAVPGGPAAGKGVLRGVLSLISSGSGFARLEDGSAEYFVPERFRGWALPGDLVELRRLPPKPGPAARGRGAPARRGAPDKAMNDAAAVVRVLKRGREQYVGQLSRQGKACYVTLRQGELELDLDVEGVPEGVPQNDWIVASAPGLDDEGREPAPARFLSHLGGPDTAHLDTLILIKKAGLKEEFSPATLQEAASLPKEPREEDFAGRLDLRGEVCFTIDGADAKDFDDAVSIERRGRGWRLGVHIADVSHYVRPGSALDKEAYERGTSVYLPDRVLPMLPEALSNGLCSLKEGVPRLCESALMDFDERGVMTGSSFASSVIRSSKRFTYEQVEEWLDKRSGLSGAETPRLGKALDAMKELAQRRRERRVERGALDFNFPETKVDLDEKGLPIRLWRRTRLFAHQLIEEFMLAANEAVASELLARSAPLLFRIHENPDEERLADTLALLGRMKLGAPRGASFSPKDLQRILKKVEGKKEERLVNTLMLRSLKLARYSPEHDIHFGLALENYCHFTSPIRRYPDLLVHRSLRAAVLEGRPAGEVKALLGNVHEMGLQCSTMERRAESCERDCVKAKQVRYLEGHLGEAYEATVTSVTNFGFFAEINAFPAEGLVSMAALEDDYYEFDSQWMRLEGRKTGKTYSIGDAVKIVVKRADWMSLQVDFGIAD
jgi:ribonuclease R